MKAHTFLSLLLSCLLSVVQGNNVMPFHTQAFAAFAGFGGASGGSSKTKKGKANKKRTNKKPKQPILDLTTAQGRMAHVQNRIQRADLSTLTTDPNASCIVDNFLGPQLIAAMRSEAESVVPTMVPSQSTKWSEELQRVVAYEKEGVLSTQIEGGPEGYAATPCLVEYIVTLTQHLATEINKMHDARLSTTQQTNKLAVCLGNGSKYDKHIDNLGGGSAGQGDLRKLSALLYLQQPGSHSEDADTILDERGGYFRAYDVPSKGEVTQIAPKGDRLLLFWSDSLVHDVSPSFCATEKDRRFALTVWFVVDEGGTIRATDAEIEDRHFGTG
jgi:hypothetical protein